MFRLPRVAAAICCAGRAASTDVTVKIRQGTLRGTKQRSALGTDYLSFKGVPYAKPPIGPLRFQPPQPAEKWRGTRDATTHGNISAQINLFTGGYRGAEDCLYLNVCVPVGESDNQDNLKPVMVWFHGGGFIFGSGNFDSNGPDYLIKHDVLFVSVNSRLGVLGYMTTGDSVVPGNMGVKDKVMALQWIKDNIECFGGDPNNVTIFGMSSGGMSCQLLMLSPMGKGLFHRAITQSGAFCGGDIFGIDVIENSYRLAKLLGLSANNSAELVRELRKVPAEILVENQMLGISEMDNAKLNIFPFTPTIEATSSIGEAIIQTHPMNILKSNSYSSVPYIIGINADEAMFYLPKLGMDPELLLNMDQNVKYLLPNDIDNHGKNSLHIGQGIKQFYFGDKRISYDTVDTFLKFHGDKIIIFPSYRSAKLHAGQTSTPVYFYCFSVDAGLNYLKELYGLKDMPGACHGDDVGYILHCNSMTAVEPGSVEDITVARMTKMWTDFAKTGNPTPDGQLGIMWSPFTSENQCYLHIANDVFQVEKNPFHDRMSFWENLYATAELQQ